MTAIEADASDRSHTEDDENYFVSMTDMMAVFSSFSSSC